MKDFYLREVLKSANLSLKAWLNQKPHTSVFTNVFLSGQAPGGTDLGLSFSQYLILGNRENNKGWERKSDVSERMIYYI